MAIQALIERDPAAKVRLTQSLHAQRSTLFIDPGIALEVLQSVPGCPDKPELRSHLDVPKRSPFTTEGLAALLHSVTHSEFNAIKTVFKSVFHRVKCSPA